MSKIIWYYLITLATISDAVGRFLTDNNAKGCNPPLACINLNDCEQFKNLTMMAAQDPQKKATTLKFLKTSLCGFDGIQPKICCSKLQHDDGPSNNSPNFSTIITVPSQVEVAVINSSPQCKSPYVCIELSKCSPMVNLARMESPINPVVAKFIKSQSCGSKDDGPAGNPRVCCSSLKSPGSLFSNRTLDNSEDYLHGTTTAATTTTTTIMMSSSSSRRTIAAEEITTRTASKKHSTLVPLWEKSKAMNFIMENWFDYTYFDFLRRRRRIYNRNIK